VPTVDYDTIAEGGVGSTEMTARLGDNAALELIQVHDSLVRRSLFGHGGREVKHTGDGMMAAFDKVANAVRAAAEIQCRFANYNAGAAESLNVRIGIDASEPVANHNDLFGATVHLAHRLCSEADADDVLVSGIVRELCEENAAHCIALGELQLRVSPQWCRSFASTGAT
jgi:class 3 adenylate cyclase